MKSASVLARTTCDEFYLPIPILSFVQLGEYGALRLALLVLTNNPAPFSPHGDKQVGCCTNLAL